MKTAVLGGGCFWCTEAAYQQLEGVKKVISGYAGGHTDKPTYREVCNGNTGHAEAIKIQFNEEVLSYEEILEFFFRIHDPTTEDRQGPDTGSQYRSIILYSSEEQKEVAESFLEEKQPEYEDEIVTELKELDKFWKAEEKHQDYFEKNPEDAYCTMHAQPKIEKAKVF
ncbi:peptide-methionine (S)-S-oxide reductase MsrA [Candidatus Nanohalobium constans]|uniref:Peptide methionine sulfoxide reductase MsrA n=1 Tax=Candidatus Nanohalobium constans TaxID=2565781 RepID=A0A5Q0UIC9_9ARCH|nr:peptide-methionine (S)-S-oxide reductase MsrA [Candidatus Nanohalobium constans]QGA80639.1 peptide-methionine (S)-S-oxide reductase [Candidatus Nanohalobium constans]